MSLKNVWNSVGWLGKWSQSIRNKINDIQNNITTPITIRYVPTYIYEYVNFDSSRVNDVYLYIQLRNISGSTINLTDYQLWFSFKNSDGNTLAKPSTSTAFSPETTIETEIPSGEIDGNATYDYVIRCENITSELTESQLADAKYWSIGFRQILESSGTTNIEQNNIIINFQVTIKA